MTSTTPHLVAEYDIPTAASYPRGITGGPDGNVWFVESKTLKIASVTTTGIFREFDVRPIRAAQYSALNDIASQGGDLWVTEAGTSRTLGDWPHLFLHWGTIVTATTGGVLTYHAMGGGGILGPQPSSISPSPDGTLWVASSHNLVHVTAEGEMRSHSLPGNQWTYFATVVANGDAWCTTFDNSNPGYEGEVGRMGPHGRYVQFPIGVSSLGMGGIASGTDGHIWFAASTASEIGRVTATGNVELFPVSGAPNDIIAGPDHAMWFTQPQADELGRITMAGVVTEYPLAAGSNPSMIALGPDGNLWVTEPGTNKIGVFAPQ